MLRLHLVLASALALGQAQTFDGLTGPNWQNVSDSCATALNTTVANCPSFLNAVSIDTPRLKSDQLSQLCTPECKASLANVRSTIAAGCDSGSDTVEWEGTIYPATLVIDRFRYAYDLSCRKDSNSGEYCDIIYFSWLNQTSFSDAQMCSDCNLGTIQTHLNSPFDYEDEYAQEFQSLTSSCGATSYAFTSPPPYAIRSATETDSPTATPSPLCKTPYQVISGDTCDAIATGQQVSTYGVISAGGLNPSCTNLRAGSTLCLPDSCLLYRVKPMDNCTNIVSTQSIDGQSLLAWNPNINSLCGNIHDLVGTQICVGPPGGPLESVHISTPLAVSTATTPVQKPTNAPVESKARCGTWYTIQEGDYCDAVSVQQGIALQDFYFLNPEINEECSNLLLGLAYCVAPIGDIATYSGYPSSSAAMTLTSISFTTTSATVPPIGSAVPSTEPPLPLASGSDPDCDYYVEPIHVPGVVDQSDSASHFHIDPSINSCGMVAATYGVYVDDLLKWNPSLSSSTPCMLDEGYRFCALRNATAVEPSLEETDTSYWCVPVESDTIRPETIATCSCYMQVEGDLKGLYSCSEIAKDGRITIDKLMSYNPWLGSDCDSSLFAGMAEEDVRAVCVDVNSTAPTASATEPAAPAPTTGSTGPTQTGITKGCQKYYTVKDGDTCASVYGQAGITFDQLYAWNPAIGSECHSLWLGYAYCVSGPSATTSSASTVSPSAAPLRSGTPDNCSQYYTVRSGDGCAKIQDLFSIDFSTLYRWNPSIGADCENLWLDYGVCVAGGPGL